MVTAADATAILAAGSNLPSAVSWEEFTRTVAAFAEEFDREGCGPGAESGRLANSWTRCPRANAKPSAAASRSMTIGA
jgi:hypothetical protein